MLEGEIIKWFDKGYGFIQRADGELPNIYCHVSQISHGDLQIGDRVRFDLATDLRTKKTQAVNVELL